MSEPSTSTAVPTEESTLKTAAENPTVAPTVSESTNGQSGNAVRVGSKLIVNKRQDGNPVLKYVRNVAYEWSTDIRPDFVCFRTCGLLYLTLKWHKLHPAYLETRVNDLNNYELKVLLILVNVDDPSFLLRDLNILCYRSAWTMIVSYSVEEAAEYIENLKLAENRNPSTVIQKLQDFRENRNQPKREPTEREKNRKKFEQAVKFLSSIRAVSNSDAKRLLGAFGSIVAISKMTSDQLAQCPGTGSETAGKVSACAGCPNQQACSTGVKPILILSGKGGVGKSSVTTNLALALAADSERQVGVLDVDICGPSQARLFNCENESVHDSASGWSPVYVRDNVALMSIAFLLESRSNAVVWRGPRKNAMIKKFLKDVDWGQLDYLLIDTPPGTSDEHISIVQLLLESSTIDGAVVVTTPQEVSLLDVRKEINFCQKTGVPVLGVVENMSSFVCPCCDKATELFPASSGGATKMCEELGLRLLAKLPHDPRLAKCLDLGEDFLETHENTPAATAFIQLAKDVGEIVKMVHRVVISGVGCVSPYGVGVKALWSGIKSGRSALRFSNELETVVGRIPFVEESADGFDVNRFPTREQREMTRATLLTLTAAEEALRDSKMLEADSDVHEDTGVNIGMGICDLNEVHQTSKMIESGNQRKVSPFFVPRILTNIPAGYVSLRYGLKGGTASATTACATGASCIGEAFSLIQSGRVRRMLAGSVESSLTKTAVVGFQRMRALANGKDSSVSRPFDAKREGFVLSEGAGVVMLERLDEAKARGVPIYAEVLGYGMSNDAFHLTAPRPDGLASTLCMKRCLADAKLRAEQVSYVNAHATSTIVGDRAEAASVAQLGSNIPISSVKGHLGHCVSAAGSLETIVSIMAMKSETIPPTLNLHETDIDADVDLIKETFREWKAKDRKVFLKNSFGFGGAFVSLAIGEI
ncbi:Cytosolic Fe-S cluster assembly factor NUBP1-like protein [Aphelenchoides besseyi]|nr:Cytosolic Fe-S cluster assembly factor NUBP1-like protein [Aphelenchoides besseyi]